MQSQIEARPRAIIALALALAGCAGATTLPAEGARRRPDGVAIDPISAPPPAKDRAEATDGLVTLRTPLGIDRAQATVEELFRKIVVEDGEGLDPLFTRDALAITTLAPGGGGQTPQALLFWQGRFRKLDYTKLAGELLYRDAELTFFRAEDAIDAPPHPAIRTDALAGNDVVVRVPILTPRIGAERLFGDEMILWLRRDGDRYRIYRILEDFQLN
ncbi:MAG: hypothetical protein QM820_33960 [Minicystis sp.]